MPTIEELRKLLEADPDDTFVLYGLAQEHAKAGQTEEAVGFFDRCLARDPHYCYAYFHKARAQEAAGGIDEARATLLEGQKAAQAAGDAQALGEITEYLTQLPR